MRCVTLTTDFGQRDGFVGLMKAVILDRAGHIPIVDLARDPRPGDIRAAAGVLMSSFRRFPPGTVQVAVSSCGAAGKGEAPAVFGSAGFLEISVRGSSAAGVPGLGAGSRVRVEPA